MYTARNVFFLKKNLNRFLGDVSPPSKPISRSDSFKPPLEKGFGVDYDREPMVRIT